jgi:hypothetical protein
MENTYSFDELNMLDLFKSTIGDAFKNDSEHKKDYWYELFGNRDVKFYESYQVDEPQFPCIVITIEATPYQRNIHSSEIEQFSFVSVGLEHYNQSVNNSGKEKLGIMINHRIKTVLQKTFGLLITSNKQISSPDNSLYRRRIEMNFVYDNKNKVFYRER